MTTSLLQAKAVVPEYDRSKLVARIAHIGFGAFHRAHQVVCADKLAAQFGSDWGYCEINLIGGEQQIKDIRQALECAIARRAVEFVTDEQLLVLEHNLHWQELAAQNEQIREFLSLDDDFHQLLTQVARCPLAWETIESIKATMDRVRFLSLSQVSSPLNLIKQHYLIFNSLKAHDPDAAEAAIREHLQEMIYSITPIAEQNRDWFDHPQWGEDGRGRASGAVTRPKGNDSRVMLGPNASVHQGRGIR